MDVEQTTGVQPETSEVENVLLPEDQGDLPNEEKDVVPTLVSLEPSTEIQSSVLQNEHTLSEDGECSQDMSSEIVVEVASELPEPSLPTWIAEEVGDELNAVLPIAIRHVKAMRGGDLLGIILPSLDADTRSKRKGKTSLLVIIKGEERNAEWIRVKQYMIHIFYRGQKEFEGEIARPGLYG